MKQPILPLIASIADQLAPVYHNPAEQEQAAWWLLQAITQRSEAQLLAVTTLELTQAQETKLLDWITKHRDEHMPLQYLIGSVPFIDVTIAVQPPTLIPRPETEEWCFNLIQQLKQLPKQPLAILDLCTGSGCIAVALAKALPHATVYATDIAEQALALAKKNAQLNHVVIKVILSDIYDGLDPALKFDCIVANPPYIAPEEWDTLDLSVTQWEDKQALVAPDHGLALIERIITQAHYFLKPNQEMQKRGIPQLVIEIGYQQAEAVKEELQQAGFTTISVVKDLEGKDRIVCARR